MLPENVNTGRVHGRFIVGVQDGADADGDPDYIAAQGTVSFQASVPYLQDPTATPPVTIFTTVAIKGALDSEGHLRTLQDDGTLGALGVLLIATDDPDLMVQDWTWAVTYDFEPVNGVALAIEGHSMSLPSDSEKDLTTSLHVPSSPGIGLPQAEAAALRAEAAAVSSAEDASLAVAAADRAEQAAGATDEGIAALLDDPASATGGVVSQKLALKLDATELSEALSEKADLVGGRVPDSQLPTSIAENFDSLFEGKADQAALTSGLATKAEASDLAGKADLSDFNALASDVTGKVYKGELVVNVRDYGAVGDNITDDTQAIQNAINSLPNEGGRGGGTVLFDSGNYRITSTLVVANHGVHLRSSGAYTAVITPTESVAGFAILYEIPNSAVRGPRVSDLRINCAGSSAGGLRIAAAYDNAILDNVFVSGLNDGATGIELSPNPGASTLVSQTIVATNVWVSGNRSDRKHTGKCWYLDAVQEAVFIGCKGLAGGETSGTAWHIKGVKGVVLTGCSAAFAATGFVIDSTDRAQSGITIDTPTLESVGQTMVTTGGNMTSYMSFRNPRSQVGETLPAGPITLNKVADSTFELHNIVLSIGTTSERIHALTVDKSNVTDNGVNSTVIQWANSLNPYTVNSFAVERANTPYMRMSVAGRSGYHQMQWGASATADNGYQHQYNDGSVNRYVHRVNGAVSTQTWFGYASGASAEIFKIDRNPAVNKAGAYLFINDGSLSSLKQVEIGAPDSGGVGYRMLRVVN